MFGAKLQANREKGGRQQSSRPRGDTKFESKYWEYSIRRNYELSNVFFCGIKFRYNVMYLPCVAVKGTDQSSLRFLQSDRTDHLNASKLYQIHPRTSTCIHRGKPARSKNNCNPASLRFKERRKRSTIEIQTSCSISLSQRTVTHVAICSIKYK